MPSLFFVILDPQMVFYVALPHLIHYYLIPEAGQDLLFFRISGQQESQSSK